MGIDSCVERLARIDAVVARITTTITPRFAEVPEQLDAPTTRAVGERSHLVELGTRDATRIEVFHFREKSHIFRDITARVQEQALGGKSIASRASCLLVIAFDVLGQIGVNHKSHVGFVDAHTKRNRRAHDAQLVA